ncbi:unnamed protein product [Adineta steineri]|uniref:Uncharacterized protein n=1 Tax=Adineta steineri TaxID=433720 RepID=A0A815TNF1_9BILA|nr:unnamed protein product [Adineta steineri]CAF4110866.1 unnamed protein product [Adineta steineri]
MIEKLSIDFVDIDDLRQIALLIYRCAVIELEQSLWSMYLKMGTGTWNIDSSSSSSSLSSPEIWPMELKSTLLLIPATEINGDDNNNNNIDDRCLQYVNTRLRRLEYKQQKYTDELNAKIQSTDNYKLNFGPQIQLFIEENLQTLRIQYQYAIALTGYEYEDCRFEFEFLAQDPNQQQIEWFKCLKNHKYEQEKVLHEYLLLKEQIQNKRFSDIFHSIQHIIPSTIFETIHDDTVHHYLDNQQAKILDNYRTNILTLLINRANIYRTQTENLFYDQMLIMWQKHKTLPIKQQLNSIMLNLIDQSLMNITAKLECIYSYEMFHSFGKTNIIIKE